MLKAEQERVSELERENRQLKQANEILRKVRPSGTQPATQESITFIDDHCDEFGVESICAELPVARNPY